MSLVPLHIVLVLESPAIILDRYHPKELPREAYWTPLPVSPPTIPGALVRGAIARWLQLHGYRSLVEREAVSPGVSVTQLYPVAATGNGFRVCLPAPALSLQASRGDGNTVAVLAPLEDDDEIVGALLEKDTDKAARLLAEKTSSKGLKAAGKRAGGRLVAIREDGLAELCPGARRVTVGFTERDPATGRAPVWETGFSRLYTWLYEALEAGQIFHGLAFLRGDVWDAVRESSSGGSGLYFLEAGIGRAVSHGYGRSVIVLSRASIPLSGGGRVYYTLSPYAPELSPWRPRLVLASRLTTYSRWSILAASSTPVLRVKAAGSIAVYPEPLPPLEAASALPAPGPGGLNHMLPSRLNVLQAISRGASWLAAQAYRITRERWG